MTPEGIQELPNGQWVVEGDTHLGKWAITKGTIVTDPNLFKFLRPALKEAGVESVWDIGANIGDHTRQYLDWGMEVVAIEPHTLAYECLKHNCPEAACMNIAASSTLETLRFTSQDNVGASRVNANGELQVAGYPLDSLDLPAPDFIKIDVEGFEVKALWGMEKTIKAYHPLVYIEINRGALKDQGHTPEDIVDFLKAVGYHRFYPYPERAKWGDQQFDLFCRQ